MCLQVVGAYISWIDIGLIANDRFVSVLLRFMTQPLIRETACDCIYEIISKGMDPMAKIKLIESFATILDTSGLLTVNEVSFRFSSWGSIHQTTKIMNIYFRVLI